MVDKVVTEDVVHQGPEQKVTIDEQVVTYTIDPVINDVIIPHQLNVENARIAKSKWETAL